MSRQTITLALMTLILAACGSAPERKVETRETPAKIEDHAIGTPGGYLAGDGPGKDAPVNFDEIPDAVPRIEPLHRYANRPYVALDKVYTPLTFTGSYKERGIASWYGKKFHGQPTSCGEMYDMYGMTAAHPTLPIPSYVRVTNTANKKYVVVRINDRGPFLHDRVIDLSYTAAHKLGIIGNGSSEVEIESIAADTGMHTIAMVDNVESRPLGKAEPAGMSATPVKNATASGNIYLQLGAFKSKGAAESFMAQMRAALGDTGKQLGVFNKDGFTRIQLGPYATPDDARCIADGLKGTLGFTPVVKLH